MAASAHALNPRLLHVNHIGQGNMPPGVDTFGERVTRWHELDIITWGNGVDHVLGRSWPVRAGDVFYRVPGLWNKHDLPYHCYFFVFDPYYAPEHEPEYAMPMIDRFEPIQDAPWEPIAPFSFATQPYLGKASDPNLLASLAFNLFLEFNSPASDPFNVKVLFLQLLNEVMRQLAETRVLEGVASGHEHYRQTIIDVCDSIKSQPQMRHSLSEMAERTNLSPNFFCRIFRELSGETFVRYVNRVKLNYVKLQLLDSEKTVSEISEECNFCDPAYLHTLFKREVGCTPMQYRKHQIYRMLRNQLNPPSFNPTGKP